VYAHMAKSKSLTIFFEVNCLSILFLFCVLVYSLRLYLFFEGKKIKAEDEQKTLQLLYSIDPRTSIQSTKVPREPILITEK